jgi:hypothetical protein
MKLFEGKSPAERNKIIAASVLGVLSLGSLWIAFGGSIFSNKPNVTVTAASPTPKSSPSPNSNRNDAQMPSQDELELAYVNSEVNYVPARFNAPDAGRNIFAFYEPPPPTPYVTPIVVVKPPTPIPPPPPTPTPEFLASSVTPQSVYAGSKGFRLEVYGDRFTPDSRIYFNGGELATTFISPQKLTADIPANLIAGEGARQIIVQTPDGKLYSNQIMLNVQAPPRPDFQYIGMIARRGFNNDTAYFQEKNKPEPFGARLNDIVAGRFRVFSISSSEVVFEDKELGFRHKMPLYRPAPGQNASTNTPDNQRRRGNPNTFTPYNPNNPNTIQQEIPGIPGNIPLYVPPPQPRQNDKKDDDDDDDGDGRP